MLFYFIYHTPIKKSNTSSTTGGNFNLSSINSCLIYVISYIISPGPWAALSNNHPTSVSLKDYG